MDWYSVYWQALKTAIKTAWPEVTVIMQDSQAQRRDWINLLNANQLTAPWCIVNLDMNQTTGWGAGTPKFQINAKINYVAQTSAAAAATTPPLAAPTITEFLTSKLIGLQLALYASPGLGTVLPSAPLDVSAEDSITRILLDAKLPFQSSALTVSSIVIAASS